MALVIAPIYDFRFASEIVAVDLDAVSSALGTTEQAQYFGYGRSLWENGLTRIVS